MKNSFKKLLAGYATFRKKYATGDQSIMKKLAYHGQKPAVMVVACCDSRADPSLIFQTDPGDLFVVRNVANIIPPYESDESHHGTSAALEFGICYLKVKHLVILGHSQCGGIEALLNREALKQNDFISHWVSLIQCDASDQIIDDTAKKALLCSYKNALGFPWIQEKIDQGELQLHLWYFDIQGGEVQVYAFDKQQFEKLADDGQAAFGRH